MKSLKVFVKYGEDYKSFLIPDVETFLLTLREDPSVALKYKTMDEDEFIEWAQHGVTPKQFEKLQSLNK